MYLSAGARKDILVMMFAYSLISERNHQSVNEDDSVVSTDNKSYKVNKRIDRRLETLVHICTSYMDEVRNLELSKWINSKIRSKESEVLKAIQREKEMNMETLAMWILYVNFVERTHKLDDSMIAFKEFDYMTLADMLESTSIGRVNGSMMMMAYDVVSILKG